MFNASLTFFYIYIFCVFQNELRILFTALTESKHHLLQKMVGTTDRPASKQLEVDSDLLIKKDKKDDSMNLMSYVSCRHCLRWRTASESLSRKSQS